MNHQSIQCDDVAQLVAICAQLVPLGVTFEASTHTLKITFTGGY